MTEPAALAGVSNGIIRAPFTLRGPPSKLSSVPPNGPMRPPNDVISRWFALKRERGCIPSTIQHYRWAVRRATRFLKRAGRPVDPRKWSADDARWLRRCFNQDPWKISILADLARFGRNFVFYEVGLPPRRAPSRVRWLTPDEARALIDVTRGDRLLRLVALLGLGQGLRRIEWLRMRAEDIDLVGGRLLIRGKGRGQPRMVWMPMHPALPDAFRAYLWWRDRKVRRLLRKNPLTPIPPELFLHRRGDRLIPYGEGGANRWMLILERRLAARGITVKLATHMLRRSGATLLEKTLLESPEASRDGVYRSVQEFLRHESIATTMRYLDRDPSRQRRAMEAFGTAFDWNAPVPGAVGSTRRRTRGERRGAGEAGLLRRPPVRER
jgi:integrase